MNNHTAAIKNKKGKPAFLYKGTLWLSISLQPPQYLVYC